MKKKAEYKKSRKQMQSSTRRAGCVVEALKVLEKPYDLEEPEKEPSVEEQQVPVRWLSKIFISVYFGGKASTHGLSRPR